LVEKVETGSSQPSGPEIASSYGFYTKALLRTVPEENLVLEVVHLRFVDEFCIFCFLWDPILQAHI
jgi:hypothetical protein